MDYAKLDKMVGECLNADSQAAYLEQHYGELTSSEADVFLSELARAESNAFYNR